MHNSISPTEQIWFLKEENSYIFHFFSISPFSSWSEKKFSHFAVGSRATISTADLSLPSCFRYVRERLLIEKMMMKRKKCIRGVRRKYQNRAKWKISSQVTRLDFSSFFFFAAAITCNRVMRKCLKTNLDYLFQSLAWMKR